MWRHGNLNVTVVSAFPSWSINTENNKKKTNTALLRLQKQKPYNWPIYSTFCKKKSKIYILKFCILCWVVSWDYFLWNSACVQLPEVWSSPNWSCQVWESGCVSNSIFLLFTCSMCCSCPHKVHTVRCSMHTIWAYYSVMSAPWTLTLMLLYLFQP